MNLYKNVRSFRPPSRDPRQISERHLVCENPPKRFVFAQMTVGLEECFERIRNEEGNKTNNLLENETINEEVFTPSPGSTLAGRYKVIAKVGEGQSSILVKAEDTFHPEKRHVAIKTLHASYRNLGPQEASCLLHLKKADTLKVANIAHVLNTFTVGLHFCIVFEFLSPTPIYKYFQTFPFPSKVDKTNLIRKIAFQVTQCLAVLSSLNIIHADMKPENILFANGKNRDVKIIDFGNAIYWVHDEMSLYFGSFELQTVFYRAPEVMFGLPFDPQIDMWSLGCVLAELYLGEPLFLATSKDEILEKMQTLLGPFPMVPFQSGKYFSTFKKFVGRTSTIPGYSQNVVNILKKLGSTDYMFADFLARLLTFDPRLRLSPVEAARHPFLAPECPLGFILPPGNSTQESGYSPILLTPATYPFRPKIDEKIKQRHYSELDLLRAGTQARIVGENVADNVMKVLPFNYQKESILSRDNGQHCIVDKRNKTEAEDSSSMVGSDGRDDTPVIHGVSSGVNYRNNFPVTQDRRDNAFNESCSVLHATNDRRSSFVKGDNADDKSRGILNRIREPRSVNEGQIDAFKEPYGLSSSNKDACSSTRVVKQDQRDSAFSESCSIINTIKEQRSVAGCVNEGHIDAFKEPYSLSSSDKDACSSTRVVKQDQRDSAFSESCSIINTIKEQRSVVGCVDEGQIDAFNEPYSLSKTTEEDRRNNAFDESCSVPNTLKEPRCFSKAESHKKREKKGKRARKLVLRKSSLKTRRRRHEGEETESRYSILTDDISDDNTDDRKSYAARDKLPAKFNDDGLPDVPEPETITRTSGAFDGKKTDRTTAHDIFCDDKLPKAKGKAATRESKVESGITNVAQLSLDEDGDENPIVTKCQRIGHTRTRPTESSAQRKIHVGQPLFMPAVNECGDEIEIINESGQSGDQRNTINDPGNIGFDESGDQRNIINNESRDPEIFFIGDKENIISESGNQKKSTKNSKQPETSEKEKTVGLRPMSDSRSKIGTRDASNDASNPNVVTSNVGRRENESKKQVRSRKVKDDSQTEPNLLRTVIGKDVAATSNRGNYQDERTSNPPSEVNFFKANSNEVSSKPNTSTAGSSQCHKVEETVTKPHLLNKKTKTLTSSNSQVFPNDEYRLLDEETRGVTSSIKNGQYQIESSCNSKEFMPAKSSSIEPFFDNWDSFSDDETSLVSSTIKPGGLRTKRPLPAKSSSAHSFPKGKSSSSDGESKLVASSKKQDRLPPNNNRKKTMPAKSSNFQSFSKDGESSSDKESKLVTSSVKEDNNSNVSTVGNMKEPRTPNLQRKESVFDTPANVVTSTRELLPGRLSEVKKAISLSEHNLNSLQEIQNISQAPLGGSSQKTSKGKRNDKTSGKARKAHKNASPKGRIEEEVIGEVSSGSRCDEDKRCQVFRNESQDSQTVANAKPSTNSPKQMEFLPTDILTQDEVKPPRKRKLSYKPVNSSGQTMFCLRDLRERQAAKVQKLSDAKLNDENLNEVVILEDDSGKPSRSKSDGYSQKRDIITKKKENSKQSEEVRDFSSSIAKKTFQRFIEDDWSVEDCLCKNNDDSLTSVKVTDTERGEDLFVNKNSRSSENKQCFERTSQSGISLFDDHSQYKDQLAVRSHSEPSDEEYEDEYDVLLL